MIRATALAFICLMAAALIVVSPAQAQDPPGNNGTIKVHDNNPGEPDPIVKNQPHVCEFDLHFFFADAGQTGDWWIKEWPPTSASGPSSSPDGAVLAGTYEADVNGEDREPEAGYFTLDDGHYKLFWEGRNPQNIKHKVFWVDCPEEAGGEQPGGEQPGGEQPGGEQPGGQQPGGEGVLGGGPAPAVQELPDTAVPASGWASAAALAALFASVGAGGAAWRARRARAIR